MEQGSASLQRVGQNADVRRLMSLPQRQRVAQICKERGLYINTLYFYLKTRRLKGKVAQALE